MHIANVRAVGRWRYARTPQWIDDGYADYIARDIDLDGALQKLKEDARELDPRRSGLYLRYQLMVAFLLDKQAMSVDTLFAAPPVRQQVESRLTALRNW